MRELLKELRPYRFPLISLGLCVLAYGLIAPWLGFYWDDWALAWFFHQFGANYFVHYEPIRPLSGWLYSVSFSLLHDSALAWHIYALLWRWASVLAFWWLLRLLWPRRERFADLAALIFALYPGFSQQPIAVTYSLYWMYYTFFLVSLSLTVLATRTKKSRAWLTLGAITLSLLTMFSTEYFYGLELLRPLVIWIALGSKKSNTRQSLRRTLESWAPYLLLVVVTFTWRYSLANQPGNLYSTELASNFIAHPLITLVNQIGTMLGDFWEAGLAAWARLVEPWTHLEPSSKVTWIYAVVVVAAAGLAAVVLRNEKEEKQKEWRQPLILGAGAMVVGGLSFWVAELPLRLSFAWDRFTLPMMFGVAILLALGIESLRVRTGPKLILVVALLGLAAGYHFFNANSYREEWETQRNFFQQLAWRAPHIDPATALLSVEPPLEHYTDNSLTAPLVWIYNRDPITDTIPYYMAYLDLRTDAELLGNEDGEINKIYRQSHFVGSSKDVIIFYFQPPACLRILDPELDPLFPKLPELLAQQAPRSNLARIGAEPNDANNPLFPFWSANPDNSWCYYFEKADLARQLGDWQQVADYGDIAFALDDAPNHPAERTPFIEGYAHLDNWKRSIQLTKEALEINPLMQPMLCKLWVRITNETADSSERIDALAEIFGDLELPRAMNKKLDSVLIANRAEIAARIARACRELGLRSIAVYSQADTGAMHVRAADEAVEIGPAEASKSYLNFERVLGAAKHTGAQAVHPGYGFLAENADFAEAVIEAGLVWIGPQPTAMRAMGDKAKARTLMEKAGVPVLPGYQGNDDPASLTKAAEKIGFPLLVKAAAGGGGVGQRVVNKSEELNEGIDAARREAQNAFGDQRLILEKYLPVARHIEFQVLGDEHGNLLHLFERECSLQRRRQKIVEETPSPLMDAKLRAAMSAAALAAAKAVGYTNAGTVEFLVDPETRKFYFLEMNTRLQVEHPITELVCGIDIVQWQLRVAAGEKLALRQENIKQTGHAIECRVYAEDPAAGFLPQAGRVLKTLTPGGEEVRVDAGAGEGSLVSAYYDPLLAKLSVHATDRPAALNRMQTALRGTAFLGVTTNIEFLQDLLADQDVIAGNYDTRFVENQFTNWSPGELPVETLIAAGLLEMHPVTQLIEEDNPDPYSPWAQASGFRLGGGR